jgi:hypothetical protein
MGANERRLAQFHEGFCPRSREAFTVDDAMLRQLSIGTAGEDTVDTILFEYRVEVFGTGVGQGDAGEDATPPRPPGDNCRPT